MSDHIDEAVRTFVPRFLDTMEGAIKSAVAAEIEPLRRELASLRRQISARAEADPQSAVRQIVEDALAALTALGMEREAAAGLLAAQSLIRMPNIEARRGLLHLVDDSAFEDPAARAADGEGG